MAIRQTTHVLKHSNIVGRPLPSTLLTGEPVVNTAEGIMYFSGVTTSTSDWTPAGTATNFFEVGSNLYDLKLRNQITTYQDITGAGLVGKFLSGTTSGFVLANISDIGGSIDHNLLTNLQGGTAGEYYHLTATEYGAVTSSNSPSSGNPFATISDIAASSGDTNEVRVSSNDSTAGFLEDKLSGGTNVTLTTINDGGNETLKINVSGLDLDTYVTGGTITTTPDNSSESGVISLSYTNDEGGSYTLPFQDIFVVGGTFNSGTGDITFTKNDGTTFDVDLSSLDFNDTFSTGTTNTVVSTDNSNTQSVDITGNDGFTDFTVSLTDTFVTGGTLTNSIATFTKNDGSNFDLDLSSLDVNDTFSTGTTNTVTATNDSNTQSVDITGNDGFTDFTLSSTDTFVTGGTLNGNDLVLTQNNGTEITTDLSSLDTTDTFVTGFTYNDANTLTISQNGQSDLSVTIDTVTGITNTGNLDLQGELSNSTGNLVINDDLDITGTTNSWGDILPGVDLGYDLGSPSKRWGNIYAGNVSATGLTIPSLGANRVVYTDGSGGLTTEAGFEYNDTTDLITVGNINVTNPNGTPANIGQGGLIVGSGGSSSTPGIGDLTVHGDLTVFGDTTTVSTSELYIEDPQITLNYNPTGDTSSTSVASGILVQDGNGTSTGDTYFTIGQMQNLTGIVAGETPDVSEYTGLLGYENRGWVTQLNDIVIRNNNLNSGSPDGVRVLAEFDVLDGGTY